MNPYDLSVYIDGIYKGEPITSDLIDYLVLLYKQKLRIYSLRYRGGWEPRTNKYKQLLLSLGITKRYPDILRLISKSIIVRKITGGYIIGIDPRIYYPGSKIKLADYVRILEFGTSAMNARPLLRLVKGELETNFEKYYLQVLGGEAQYD